LPETYLSIDDTLRYALVYDSTGKPKLKEYEVIPKYNEPSKVILKNK